MNYIRGAVSAISAPYQYYKDINPSTLTGAIDVIVIRHAADLGEGSDVLACTPFHVRFGKWQVLRPTEKKVNVSVNGQPIPFNMKIGEAGEAFFVFETDEDIPEELMTSPILQATAAPDLEAAGTLLESGAEGGEQELGETQEPEFLDLDAHAQDQAGEEAPALPVESASRGLDEKTKSVNGGDHEPAVLYTEDLALDVEGYHSHEREQSEQTVRAGTPAPSSTPARSRSPTPPMPPDPAPSSSRRRPSLKLSGVPFPVVRATSEPPPDTDLDHAEDHIQRRPGAVQLQEYSWEWGAFPQPSPMMKTGFGKGKDAPWSTMGKAQSTMRLAELLKGEDEAEGGPTRTTVDDLELLRSHSVPPELEGSPRLRRKELKAELEDDSVFPRSLSADGTSQDVSLEQRHSTGQGSLQEFGARGKLSAQPEDPYKFHVCIDDRTVTFELSICGNLVADDVFHGRNEAEAHRIFEQGKIDYRRFLRNEALVYDPRLVMRWAADQYITRHDSSPLIDALFAWREAAINAHIDEIPPSPQVLPPSPSATVPDEAGSSGMGSGADGTQGQEAGPLNIEPLEQHAPLAIKPASSSWVRWWSRSQYARDQEVDEANARHAARAVSEPIDGPASPQAVSRTNSAIEQTNNDLALPLHSTPPNGAIPQPTEKGPISTTPELPVVHHKKYAKTLRLTSDQLKSLNLKPGANSITFSLSATGAVACTARIFVWDSTDLVVISDIDGTITKSDGLGHIFTMIGRDWTHLGVAKLYTDITRNGYKIMYLTSRAIGQADSTREYLKGIKQNDYVLPEGPVIMSPDRLIAALHREVIMRKPEVFKMACLRDIQRLFGESIRNPFYAGFGNRITDALSYRSVNVPSARIFTIDSSGEVKMELLELAGYKSSYIHMTDLVDQMFPPINRRSAPEFTDFNYWRTPLQEFSLPDLSPPSPALSARSDTSNQSALARLRNFSLGGSRPTSVNLTPSTPAPGGNATPEMNANERRSTHLREMSSFERLGNALSGLAQSAPGSRRRSLSPGAYSWSSMTYLDSTSESGEEDAEGSSGGEKRRSRRQRAHSVTSMPGSLDDMQLFVPDEEGAPDDGHDGEGEPEEEGEEEGFAEDEAEAADVAFDETLFVTDEMQKVRYL